MWRFRNLVVVVGLVTVLGLISPHTVAAEEAPVVIEPPPVGYPEITRGAHNVFALLSGVYTSMTVLEETTTAGGGVLTGETDYGIGERVLVQGSASGALLFGNRNQLVVTSVPVDVSLVFQPVRANRVSLFLFGGAGGALTVSTLTVTIPQPVPLTSTVIEDDTTVRVSAVTGALRGGVQATWFFRNWAASLFATYRTVGGSYETTQTSAMSYTYPGDSGAIAQSAAISLGADLLNTRHGLALSSAFQLRENSNLVVVSVKYLVSSSR
ncbi:MAG: hypothetical protein PF508_09920 [Spirochaeta sp.]|jgi:hypothetical protein|nr:hypothetical protein [Spirochaeta sp.]